MQPAPSFLPWDPSLQHSLLICPQSCSALMGKFTQPALSFLQLMTETVNSFRQAGVDVRQVEHESPQPFGIEF